MIRLQIDGQIVEVPEGTTVLQAAKQAGVKIPVLCDHPALTSFGSCRLCLVDVEGARTLQPSCTMPVSQNMVVRSKTPAVEATRKFILELIFSERNHFCPFCQLSGGDCDLQNAALEHGMTHWPMQPNWNDFPVDASNTFLLLDHNRCILCRRCARACSELVGMNTLGFEERGSATMLTADLGEQWGKSTCISCGTCEQVCPTGSLVNRFSAYQGHKSQAEAVPTVCVGCGVGCQTVVYVRDNRVIRIDGDFDAELNAGVLCREGRFESLLEKGDRVSEPMVRKDGKLVACSWDEALTAAAAVLKDQPAAWASLRLPAEALAMLKSLCDGVKAPAAMIEAAVNGPIPPKLGMKVEAKLGSKDGVLSTSEWRGSFTEVYNVHAGANLKAAQAYGLQKEMSAKGKKSALVALADEVPSEALLAAVKPAEKLVVMTSYQSMLTELAEVVLPVATWTEQGGHYVSLTGAVQEARQLVKPVEAVRSSEAALAGLAEKMGCAVTVDWQAALA